MDVSILSRRRRRGAYGSEAAPFTAKVSKFSMPKRQLHMQPLSACCRLVALARETVEALKRQVARQLEDQANKKE